MAGIRRGRSGQSPRLQQMAITYRIDKTAKLIRARVFGEISFDDFRTTLREMLEDPDFDPSFGRLWDVREARTILSGEDVRGIAEVVRKFVGGRRSAVVAQTDVAYGLARMYSALVEEAGIDTQAFRDMDEAMTWLQAPAQGYLVPSVFGVPQTL